LYWSAIGLTLAGDNHEKRRTDIESALKANNSYLVIGPGTVIAGEALGYIYRTDNLTDKYVDRYESRGTTRSVMTTLFDGMEYDLSRISPAPNQLIPTTDQAYWTWDASREKYDHYDSADQMYKYHNGLWVRLNGLETSHQEEMELAKACNSSDQPPLGNQNSVLLVTASMRQITTGQGEDAA
jgi:hypothetical protein